MKHTLIFLSLSGVWLALTGDLTWPVLVTGGMISLAAVVIFRNLTKGDLWIGREDTLRPPDKERRKAASVFRCVGFIVLFIPVFLGKIVTAGINMAFLAFKPTTNFWPGIVRVRGGLRSLTATTLFASLITLTPGTFTLDYDEENDDLYVHWIDVTAYGEDDFDSRVTSGLRKWMRRIEP